MSKKQRIIIFCLKAFIFAVATYCLLRFLFDPGYGRYGGFIAGYIFLFGPQILKLFGGEAPARPQIVFFAFVIISLDFGICFDFYKYVPMFDKFVHCLSGIIAALAAHYIMQFYGADKASRNFRVFFMLAFSLYASAAWELFEFGADRLLHQNMQQLTSIGLNDTMLDMLFTYIGGHIGAVIAMAPWMDKFFLEEGESEEKRKVANKHTTK
ncbi:DUF2238 domain-containing protein [Candidatus Saccharibacteria bacterium]|nr:DUF2238 domain-containing protein [Candidatus Saccharibacteria bacterium]